MHIAVFDNYTLMVGLIATYYTKLIDTLKLSFDSTFEMSLYYICMW